MIDFEYQVIRRQRRKTASISVKPDGSVQVMVPATLSEQKILELVNRKSLWIRGKIAEFKEIQGKSKEKEYVSGESFTYLGRNYRLKIVNSETNDGVKLMNGRFYVPVPPDRPQKLHDKVVIDRLSTWYKQHAVVRLREKTKRYASQMNVCPSFVGIKDYRSRWGGCSVDGSINYNWKIIVAPHSIVDYVVVHELCHLVHDDHSNKFWKLLETILPDYAERKEWLKVNGKGLGL